MVSARKCSTKRGQRGSGGSTSDVGPFTSAPARAFGVDEREDAASGGIHLWCIGVDSLVDSRLQGALQGLLSEQEGRRIRQLRSADRQVRFRASRGLVRAALSECRPEVAPGDWRLEENRFGRPFVTGPGPRPGPWFSVTHTQKWLLCAVSPASRLGLDAEPLDRRGDFRAVARRFFAAAEVEALERRPEAQRALDFLAFWTLKEALLKAKGRGLSLPLDCAEFELREDGTVRLTRIAVPGERPDRWDLRLIWDVPGHVVALAAVAGTPSPIRWHFDPPMAVGRTAA